MIDIGANLTNPAFADDFDAVLQRAQAAGIAAIIVTGTSVQASEAAIAMAESAPGLFATAGVHPHDASAAAPGWGAALGRLAGSPSVVAIGECGLDYYRNYSPRDVQQAVFRRQIELAVDIGKPLFVHDRESAGDTREILSGYRASLTGCVIHCFTGTADELDGYLADGYHIGITGWVCDERRGQALADLVPRIPAHRLMLETDAPYLLPRNMPTRPRPRRNEPAFLTWVARRVAECRNEELGVIERTTYANAMRLFGLPQRPAQCFGDERPVQFGGADA